MTELKNGAKAHPRWLGTHTPWTCFFEAVCRPPPPAGGGSSKNSPFQTTSASSRKKKNRQLLDMQASIDDVSFEQWLLRALNDPSVPGVIDLSQCTVIRTGRRALLTAEELRQLKLALQTKSNLAVLKLNGRERSYNDASLYINGLKEIVDTIGNLTALLQLDLSRKILG
jgi:hypothetical protein